MSFDNRLASRPEIVGEWMWAGTVHDAGEGGAERIFSRCADAGITDVYLMVKGTGGRLFYLKTKHTEARVVSDRDVLGEAIAAAHAHGIRLHAWICNLRDVNYKASHPDALMMPYVVGSETSRIDPRNNGYRDYMADVAAELAEYDIDGLHLDYIRYKSLESGWGESDFAALAERGADARDTHAVFIRLGQKCGDLRLHKAQVFGLFHRALHHGAIAHAVSLNAFGMYGGSFAEIEGAGLEGHLVRRASHLTAEGVDLKDEMPLARAADGGVAGKVGDGVEREGKQHGIQPQSRTGESGLDAGVPRADDGDGGRVVGVGGDHRGFPFGGFSVCSRSLTRCLRHAFEVGF